jgi:hypothetical protein
MSHFEPGDNRVHVRQRDGEGRKRGFGGIGVMAAGIAVFAGIIWYAYSQGNKAGTESVAPVLHADQSPTKVRPEQPGGMEVPHQDKLVYDRLNPGKDSEAGVERLLPPPEEPLARPKAAEAAPEPAGADGDLPPEETRPAAPAPAAPVAAAPAQPAAPAPQPAAPAPAAPVPARPVAAPPAVAAAAAPPATAAKPAAAPATKPPAQVAAAAPPAAPAGGSTRVQVASVSSEALANSEWQRIAKKHSGVLAGVTYRIVRADLGAKGTYYRVQAGPMDDAKARQVCEALKAKGDGCIPVH